MKKEEKEALLKERLIELKKFEEKYYAQGDVYIAGVDEVGRGPLAGPVVAAAVILPKDFAVLGVDDSKKVTEKNREKLFVQIKEEAIAYGVGVCDAEIIDEVNILEATKLAMKEAVKSLEEHLKEKAEREGLEKLKIDRLLIDAVSLKDVKIPQTSIIRGDSNSVSIAAASILAKVIRDDMMKDFHKAFPDYSFDSNKGYGTKAHYEGIAKVGISPIHRKTFLKNIKY